jgi:hypothetical protein
MNDKLRRMSMEATVVYVHYYSSICLEELRNDTNDLSRYFVSWPRVGTPRMQSESEAAAFSHEIVNFIANKNGRVTVIWTNGPAIQPHNTRKIWQPSDQLQKHPRATFYKDVLLALFQFNF